MGLLYTGGGLIPSASLNQGYIKLQIIDSEHLQSTKGFSLTGDTYSLKYAANCICMYRYLSNALPSTFVYNTLSICS